MMRDNFIDAQKVGKPGDVMLLNGRDIKGVIIENVLDDSIVFKCDDGTLTRWTIPIDKIVGMTHTYPSAPESTYTKDNYLNTVRCSEVESSGSTGRRSALDILSGNKIT